MVTTKQTTTRDDSLIPQALAERSRGLSISNETSSSISRPLVLENRIKKHLHANPGTISQGIQLDPSATHKSQAFANNVSKVLGGTASSAENLISGALGKLKQGFDHFAKDGEVDPITGKIRIVALWGGLIISAVAALKQSLELVKNIFGTSSNQMSSITRGLLAFTSFTAFMGIKNVLFNGSTQLKNMKSLLWTCGGAFGLHSLFTPGSWLNKVVDIVPGAKEALETMPILGNKTSMLEE